MLSKDECFTASFQDNRRWSIQFSKNEQNLAGTMIPIPRIFASSLLALSSIAFSGAWSGYVMHGLTRQPLQNVEARGPFNQRTLTDASGRYAFIADIPESPSLPASPAVQWDASKQALTIGTEAPHHIQLDLIDPSGRLVERVFDGPQAAGNSTHRVASRSRSLGPVFLRVIVDGRQMALSSLAKLAAPVAKPGHLSRSASSNWQDTLFFTRFDLANKAKIVDVGVARVDTVWMIPQGTPLDSAWNPSVAYGYLTDSRDGTTYRTVQIGNVRWMAENLVFKTPLPDTGRCQADDPANCRPFGRRYEWKSILAGEFVNPYIPRSVNGICPAEWHIPSKAEWTALKAFLSGSGKTSWDLHSMSGWTNPWNSGADLYGFRALPNQGDESVWWASHSEVGLPSKIPGFYTPPGEFTTYASLQSQYSVRCVEGNIRVPYDSTLMRLRVNVIEKWKMPWYFMSSDRRLLDTTFPAPTTYSYQLRWFEDSLRIQAWVSDRNSAHSTIQGRWVDSVAVASPARGSSSNYSIEVQSEDGDRLNYSLAITREPTPPEYGIPWYPNAWYMDAIQDTRDGKTYQTFTTGSWDSQWMAQNLDYKAPGADSGLCSMGDCAKYGRAYLWNTARNWGDPNTRVRGICPEGWHLPTDDEWKRIAYNEGSMNFMSRAGWLNRGGWDIYGFRGIPTNLARTQAVWWTSSVHRLDTIKTRGLKEGNPQLYSGLALKASARASIRCVKD